MTGGGKRRGRTLSLPQNEKRGEGGVCELKGKKRGEASLYLSVEKEVPKVTTRRMG